MAIRLSVDPTQAAAARRAILADPEVAALPASLVADLVLVASELVSNAIFAAAVHSTINVDWWRDGDRWWLYVANQGGPPPAVVSVGMPPRSTPTGRGLAIARRLASELIVEALDGGTSVRAAFDFVTQPDPQPHQPPERVHP